MPTTSKVYPVKSNAARAAKPYGITRDQLEAVSGGYVFTIPEGGVKAAPAPRAPRKPRAKTKRASVPGAAKAKPSKAKATGSKRKPGGKTGIVAEVIAELKARWTPAQEILDRTDWVSNTFRGILGAHKKKTGEKFEHKRVDGAAHYRIVSA